MCYYTTHLTNKLSEVLATSQACPVLKAAVLSNMLVHVCLETDSPLQFLTDIVTDMRGQLYHGECDHE